MTEMERFIRIVQQLRSENGCPWDKAQTHLSLRRCLVEETGEFLDAVESSDPEAMQEELGDLLLQVVLHSQIASENNFFGIEDVARAESEKLLRRHPHVFGNQKAASPEEALKSWEKSKLGEAGSQQQRRSLMDGVPRSMPALSRAQKTLNKAGKSGFEWGSCDQVLEKIEEELLEVREALAKGNRRHLEEELGDLLFAVVSLCRQQQVEAEEALQQAVAKFMRRFRWMENASCENGRLLEQCSAMELEGLWQQAKNQE